MPKTIDSAGEIISKSIEFYKKHWKGLVKVVVGYILVYVIVGIAMLLIVAGIESILKSLSSAGYVTIISQILGGIVTQGITIGLSAYVIFTLPRFFKALDEGHKVSLRGEFTFLKGRFWSFFLVIILMYGLVYGGTVALIVPGILFGMGTIFYPYTAALEHKKGIEALIASYWETYGRKADIFWRLLLVGLALMLVGIILLSIIGIVSSIIIVSVSSPLLKMLLTFPIALVGLVLFVFVYAPVSMIPQYIIYKNLKSHTRGEIDPVFHAKKKKMFKIFITIGLIVYVLFVIAAPLIPEPAEGTPMEADVNLNLE